MNRLIWVRFGGGNVNMKNEHIKQMNNTQDYKHIDFYRGDIDRDLMEWISLRELILDLHLNTRDDIQQFIIDMCVENGAIRGKFVYGLSKETVERKLKDITQEA